MTKHQASHVSLEHTFLGKGTRNTAALVLLALAVFGLGVTLFELVSVHGNIKQVLFSYLVAYLFGLTICLGGLFFVILQHLVGAIWSVTIRRIAETMAVMLPLFAILFLPILLGMKTIFPWAADPSSLDPSIAEEMKEIIHSKGAYLNPTFFMIRAAIYFVIWSVLGLWVYLRSRKLDKTSNPIHLKKLRRGSPPAMLAFGLTITFAGFDWVMSLHPDWASTIFGVYIFAGSVVSSLACIIGVALLLRKAGLLESIITEEHYHDLGKLTFGFVIFWAYIAFSQFFLIWYANIPEETHWFGVRWFVNNGEFFDPSQEGSWSYVARALVLLQFLLPFWLLLSRNAKRSPIILALVSIILTVAHYIDLFWFIIPEFHRATATFHWFDLTTLLFVVSFVGSIFVYRLGSAPLVPVGDPYLTQSMEFENV